MNKLEQATVAIADITFDESLQFRTFTDAVHVADLQSHFEQDGKFDVKPVLTRFTCPKSGEVTLWIKDGTHRLTAAQNAGATEIDVEIMDVGSKLEAQFAAMGVNTRHGKKTRDVDLQKALRAIKTSIIKGEVDHTLYMKNPYAWDKVKLRKLLGCSEKALNDSIGITSSEWDGIRDNDIERLHVKGLSIRQIAEQLGLGKSTVGDVVKEVSEISEKGNSGHSDEKSTTTTDNSTNQEGSTESTTQESTSLEPEPVIRPEDNQLIDDGSLDDLIAGFNQRAEDRARSRTFFEQ